MGNLKRYFEENAAYFVTTVTNERQPIFRDRKYCRIFLIAVEYYKTVFDYEVYGYCLMPDHFHIILRPIGKFKLPYIMQMIKGSFSRKVNKLQNKNGPRWQKRYFDEVVRDEKQLLSQLEYIHHNPTKAGLTDSSEAYPFSSFSQYYGSSNPEGILLEIDRIG